MCSLVKTASRTDFFERKKFGMNEIVTKVKEFFDSQKWHYDYFEEDCVFQSGVQINETSGLMVHAIIGEAAFTVTAASDVEVNPENYVEAAAFLNEINARLLLGCLVLDSETGVLFFRVGQNCIDQAPTAKVVEDAFMYPISFMDENYAAIAGFLSGSLSAGEALEQVFAQEA